MSLPRSACLIAVWLVVIAHLGAAFWLGRIWLLVPALLLSSSGLWIRREWRCDELERRPHPLLPQDD